MVDAILVAILILILGAVIRGVWRLGVISRDLSRVAQHSEGAAHAYWQIAQAHEQRRDARATVMLGEIRKAAGDIVRELHAAAEDRREMLQFVRGADDDLEPVERPSVPPSAPASLEMRGADSSTRQARPSLSFPHDAATPPAGFRIFDSPGRAG